MTTKEAKRKEEKQAATTVHKWKRPGKERVPLGEQENKKNGTEVDKEEVKPFDDKCKKIHIFSNSVQKDLLKRWFGTARWTYNACNAAVHTGLCGHFVKQLQAWFLNQEAFGRPEKRKPKRAKKKKKVPIAPLLKEQKQVWTETLAATGHMPGPLCDWVLETLRDIRDQAIKELLQHTTID